MDFERKTIFVRRGKRKKDRYTVLGDRMIRLLREYFLTLLSRGSTFSSHGQKHNPFRVTRFREDFGSSSTKTELPKAVHVHTLRHCFATHLLENGTNIVYIMRLLGHSSIQTTMIYLHVQSMESMNVQSPVDTFHRREQFPETARNVPTIGLISLRRSNATLNLRFGWREPCFARGRDGQISQVEVFVRRLLLPKYEAEGRFIFLPHWPKALHSSILQKAGGRSCIF